MENQRRTPSSPSNFNRNKNVRKGGERSSYGYPKYQNRDNRDSRDSRDTRFQPRGDRYQKSEGFQSRDDRFGRRPGPGRFPARPERFQGRDKFAPKGKGPAWKNEPKIKITSDLQVTDGRLRGKLLKNSASPKCAVVSRRIREAVFKIVYRKIRARRFLDLSAGAGITGIEAISRGAIVATFVERSPKMCSFIRQNLETCEIKTGHGEIFEIETMPFLKRIAKRRRFWDVVFWDARTSSDDQEVMNLLGRGVSVNPGGTVIIQHPAEVFLPERMGILRRWRVVVQGDLAISFFERK